ncbi:MAG: hypothetical protein DDT25_00010 [Chloroflexi bacterium]|nr:hypothetical protein [Chloroflexota bacterium]
MSAAYAGLRMPGTMVSSLMRKHRVTISDLAARQNVSQKRIREVRETGVAGFMADEYHFAITGNWWSDSLKKAAHE